MARGTDVIYEPRRAVPVIDEVEVLIVGGGPAGMFAAASAAREGRSTLLVERWGALGGATTGGGLSAYCGLHANVHGEHVRVVRGLADELLDRIAHLGGLRAPHLSFANRIMAQAFDIPAARIAADELVEAAGARLLLHTWAVGIYQEDDRRRIDAVVVESKSGRAAIRAELVIDASGDADIAAWAGAPYEKSGPEEMMHASTMYRIAGVDPVRAGPAWEVLPKLMREAEEAGRVRFPRHGAIVRPQRDPSEWRANATQMRSPRSGGAIDGTDVRELSDGEVEGRRQAAATFEFIRSALPGFEGAYMVDVGPFIGIRETRRVVGPYQLTEDDVLDCVDFPDAIGVNGWPVEAHVAGDVEWRFPRGEEPRGYNQLPFRMIVPQGVDNLYVVGRCASMTHGGQSAARVTGPCFAMGEAAGVAADLALGARVATGAIDVERLQRRLVELGAFLGQRHQA